MNGRALVAQADALPRVDGRGGLPLRDASVDLVLFSPPFWNLRDYGVPGQLGNEPTRQEFLEHLWAVTAECMRVMKPTANLFVELGDSYANRATPERVGSSDGFTGRGSRPGRLPRGSMPEKSLNLTPQRYAIGCIDQLGLTLRAEIIWSHVNGLPESVRDRVRQAHSRIYHFTLGPRYYAAVDEIRMPYSAKTFTVSTSPRRSDTETAGDKRNKWHTDNGISRDDMIHPLGALPGSVWAIPSEPLDLPGYFILQDGRLLDFLAPQRGGARPRPNGHHPGLFDADAYTELVASGDGPAWRWARASGVTSSPWPQQDGGLQLRVAASHYAAFPSRLPELVIRGWSPSGICLECGEGRWPVVDRQRVEAPRHGYAATSVVGNRSGGPDERRWDGMPRLDTQATILGYACACTPFTDHPGTGESSGVKYVDSLMSGDGYPPNYGAGSGGHDNLAARPRTGPWREFHLSGWQAPPTRPAVVLDCFSGVGTTIGVARQLGRIGIGLDLSFPYCRAAKWRVFESGQFGKAVARTWAERQGTLA